MSEQKENKTMPIKESLEQRFERLEKRCEQLIDENEAYRAKEALMPIKHTSDIQMIQPSGKTCKLIVKEEFDLRRLYGEKAPHGKPGEEIVVDEVFAKDLTSVRTLHYSFSGERSEPNPPRHTRQFAVRA